MRSIRSEARGARVHRAGVGEDLPEAEARALIGRRPIDVIWYSASSAATVGREV